MFVGGEKKNKFCQEKLRYINAWAINERQHSMEKMSSDDFYSANVTFLHCTRAHLLLEMTMKANKFVDACVYTRSIQAIARYIRFDYQRLTGEVLVIDRLPAMQVQVQQSI